MNNIKLFILKTQSKNSEYICKSYDSATNNGVPQLLQTQTDPLTSKDSIVTVCNKLKKNLFSGNLRVQYTFESSFVAGTKCVYHPAKVLQEKQAKVAKRGMLFRPGDSFCEA